MLIEILSNALLTNPEAVRASDSMNHGRSPSLKAVQERESPRCKEWMDDVKELCRLPVLILRRYFEVSEPAAAYTSQKSNSEREERNQRGSK